MWLIRLPFWLIGVALVLVLWVLYLPIAAITSRVAMPLLLLLGFAALCVARYDMTPILIVVGLSFVNRVLVTQPNKIGPPPRFPRLFKPRASRRVKPRPVPVAKGLDKNAPAPSVNQTLARLSPRLRAVIAQPRPPT